MLRIATTMRETPVEALAELYPEDQDLWEYLSQVFFRTPGARYCLWEEGDRLCSALRLEPYADGLLLAGLVTAPACRRRGYARSLIRAVQETLPEDTRLYSHVSRRNNASLAAHAACGFTVISRCARYIDGSVDSRAVTLRWEKSAEHEKFS